MAQITYANKVALNENPEIADINKVKDTDMNQIKEVVNANEAKVLLEVSNIAPDTCSTGDMYFNTTTNLIYTATATNTWGSTGVAPTSNTMYVTFSDKTIYMYNGTTLIKISSGIGDNEPIGKVVPMVLETAPDGYLLCDGSTYTKAAYPDLYKALVGTSFIIDTNSFRVPDIKGKVIVGKDSNDTDFDTLGETGGSKYIQEHTHSLSKGGQGFIAPEGGYAGVTGDWGTWNTNGVSDVTTGNSGNLQPYIVLNFFIKAQKLSGDVVLSESLPVGTEVDFDGQASDIPVGWEQVESYSTNEVKTGDNWIDGKPIYRKVIETNLTTSETEKDYTLSTLGLDNISTLIDLYSVSQSEPKEKDYYSSNTDQLRTLINPVNLVVLVGSSYPTRPCTIYTIIEYTKTTD